jgi:5,10-methylenetetrahydromethanopterin reductase
MSQSISLGICFHREFPAAEVIGQARATEDNGFDEFWLIEDCFYTSGPTLAAAALLSTSALTVGIGIMPAAARNPAITAMEIATLAGLAPGRFHAGIGHGVTEWMRQIGERKESPLTMLEETITSVKRLLAGESVTMKGRYIELNDVQLHAPPTPVPLVSAGVRQAKSLAMAGRVADGVILADYVNPTYVKSTRALLTENGNSTARVTAFAAMAVGTDAEMMRQIMSHVAADPFAAGHASLKALDFYDEVAIKATNSSWPEALAAMPARWWNQIGAIGTPDDAAEYIQSMSDAGTDALTFFPGPMTAVQDIQSFATHVIPLVR